MQAAAHESPERCERCYGRGWYPELYGEPDAIGVQDERERYCDCPAGAALRARE